MLQKCTLLASLGKSLVNKKYNSSKIDNILLMLDIIE